MMRRKYPGTAPPKAKNPRFSRRAFLGAAGGGVVLAPFVPLLDSEAADTGYPTRLILLFSSSGTIQSDWTPSGSGSNFTLGPILAPLAPYQDKLVIVRGLESVRSGPGDAHQCGIGSLWTGSRLLPGPFAGGVPNTSGWAGDISVDQYIANTVGAETPYKSLEFSAQTAGDHTSAGNYTRMCYAGPDQPIAPEESPQAMFDRLFGDLDLDAQAVNRLKAERGSVIDLVKGDLSKLQSRSGGGDRLKMDAHLAAIRAIETRNSSVEPTCEVPELDLDLDPNANDNFPVVSRRHIDQLVMALACDLTRVASLQWSVSASRTVFSWLGHTETHHGISHGDDNASFDRITDINIWYAEEVKYLLDGLAAVPEGDGTLLDHSLVVWGNELATGNNHSGRGLPFVLAGGANGMIETGRYLQSSGVHNRLLVSLCHAMGLTDQTSFGNREPPNDGGVPGLL